MQVKTRLMLGGLATLMGLLAVSLTALFLEKSSMMDDRKIKTRHLVEAAHTVLVHYHQQEKSGALTASQAQAAAMSAIQALRYEQKEYFWLHDLIAPVPKMLMHPTVPALNHKILDAVNFNCATTLQAGSDGLVERTDGKKNLFVAFNEVVQKSGHGYVTYNCLRSAKRQGNGWAL